VTALSEHVAGFICNRRKLKEMRRLYVNLADGTKLGFLDLAELPQVRESQSP
jgi:hypothetical protein